MAVLDDLATHLVAQGQGALGTTLFTGILPASPDTCVALLDSQSEPPVRIMASTAGAAAMERARVQVLARGMTYVAARNKAMDVLGILDWAGPLTLNGVRYHHMESLQRPPFLLNRDANDRVVFAFNLYIAKDKST
jgi:minor capsid protein